MEHTMHRSYSIRWFRKVLPQGVETQEEVSGSFESNHITSCVCTLCVKSCLLCFVLLERNLQPPRPTLALSDNFAPQSKTPRLQVFFAIQTNRLAKIAVEYSSFWFSFSNRGLWTSDLMLRQIFFTLCDTLLSLFLARMIFPVIQLLGDT